MIVKSFLKHMSLTSLLSQEERKARKGLKFNERVKTSPKHVCSQQEHPSNVDIKIAIGHTSLRLEEHIIGISSH